MRDQRSLCAQTAMACAFWLSAIAAMAQTPPQPAQSPAAQVPPAKAKAPPTPVSPLTVEGTERKVLEKQARAFVDIYAAETKLGVLARWTVPACVAVIGLIPEQAAQFKTRIEEVAKAVRAPMGPPGCTPNIEIVFTNDAQRDLDDTVARNPTILGYHGEKTVTRPIQAWYDTVTGGLRARTAGPADDGPAPPDPGAMERRVAVERFDPQWERGDRGFGEARRCTDSGVAAHNPRLLSHVVGSPTYETDIPCEHSLFLNVLVMVDAAHMGDVSVPLTADYLALVALSQPQPRALDGCLALPSVLDLYAKDCPGREAPTGLTPADMAYLAGLYAANLTVVRLNTQNGQSDIAGRMVDTLINPNAPPANPGISAACADRSAGAVVCETP
jgi:hypothetical protein